MSLRTRRFRSFLSICVLALTCASARAQAASGGPVQVAVDWRGVADRDVERCGLTRMRAGIIERLVQSGHAVVERVQEDGVQVAIASEPTGLVLHVASSDGGERTRRLPFAEPCDVTFVLDVIASVAEEVDALAQAQRTVRARRASVRAELMDAELDARTAQVTVRARYQLALEALVKLPATFDPLFGVGLSGAMGVRTSWELGARLELAATAREGVALFEPLAGATAAWQPTHSLLGLHAEVGLLFHRARSAQRSVSELDGALAVGARLCTGHLLAHLLVYARLHSFAHELDGRVALDTSRAGLIVRIGAQLFDRPRM
jgi:hypothetical protein